MNDPLANPQDLIRRVYGFVAYRVGDGPDAEDITSDVFERAVRYRDSYKRSKGEPIAWLIGIARGCIADAHQQRVRRLDTGELDEDVTEPEGETIESQTTQRLALHDALARLDERERELVALRYGADLSVRRIGRIVGMKPNAVDVALHRARARLRGQLEAAERSPSRVEPEPRRRSSAGRR
jgi:RNA polymerase sigma-70 factor, ECF subfamily